MKSLFPLPVADAAFIARWQRKVERAHAIWQSALGQSDASARRKAELAYRMLWQLMRLRDGLRVDDFFRIDAEAQLRCYACDGIAVGVRDRRPEGGAAEPACTRHAESAALVAGTVPFAGLWSQR
jgi:hypothetical protein